jgi:hypothetical protein
VFRENDTTKKMYKKKSFTFKTGRYNKQLACENCNESNIDLRMATKEHFAKVLTLAVTLCAFNILFSADV